ncbi:LysE family translocator [Nocardiopsis ansamitocini]|uniref:Lysine transporter LysE n=1 Tax=Nocardiopsis ansamitocini TaxID=1670832 RepID=A0A9W6UJJ5_9ACTN|nr:LysE family translocator [Nocardiopsis ansamitocini]GLU48904.1 lysine transporter LysE [Nocardiopsis ansamitocini]
MPMPEHLLVFVLASAVIVVLPGPDFVLVTRNTLAHGHGSGMATGLGSTTGIAAYTLLAAAGLTVMIAASPVALVVLRFAGAAYLVYLGAAVLLRLWRGWRRGDLAELAPGAESGRGGSPFTQGLLNNLLNPKPLAFFLTFLPQFVAPDAAAAPQIMLLGAIVIAIALMWWAVYVFAISHLSELLRRRRVRQGIELTSGMALTAFGVALAVAA